MNYQPIAIVGCAGRFPGAGDVDEFWQNLRKGVHSVRILNDDELRESYLNPALLARASDGVKAGAPLENAMLFDAEYFGVPKREALLMSPEQRVLLECAEDALQTAGYVGSDPEFPVGVFVGAGRSLYPSCNLPLDGSRDAELGVLGSIINASLALRISYLLDLTGPSLTLDTTCSSALVAVHLACSALGSGECDLALAGSVSQLLLRGHGHQFDLGEMRSRVGLYRPFDEAADGTVFTCGAGMVVLKRLEDALNDGDTVIATIRGSAVNNDGRVKSAFTAPTEDGQVKVIREAIDAAAITAEQIGYIETHGTGTSIGDVIEIAALKRVFGSSMSVARRCALGTLKANIGHLETAAGIASLIKVALALKHRELPPAIHFRRRRADIDLSGSPFYFNTALEAWNPEGSLRAGVSAFGFGGTNAHLVLEEAPMAHRINALECPSLLILSARTESALREQTRRLAGYFCKPDCAAVADAAYTLQVGRTPHSWRSYVLARNPKEATEQLIRESASAAAALRADSGMSVVFMFPGQGSQQPAMADDLYRTEPRYREVFDRCAAIVEAEAGFDLRAIVYPESLPEKKRDAEMYLTRTSICQPALFAVEYSLALLLKSWGIQPALLLGHSLGEYVAACLSGVWSLEDALRIVAARGRLMESVPEGRMLAVPLPRESANALLGAECSLAAVNGPASSVISGPSEAIQIIRCQLESQEVPARELSVHRAFHSAAMNEILPSFAQVLSSVRFHDPIIPFISNRTGRVISAATARSLSYWLEHLRCTVEFSAAVETLSEKPGRAFVEVGPGAVLGSSLRKCCKLKDALIITSCCAPGTLEDGPTLLHAVGQLWKAGAAIDWKAFNSSRRLGRVPLPTYPYERDEYSLLAAPGKTAQPESSAVPQLHDPRNWLRVPSWTRLASAGVQSRSTQSRGDCCIVFAHADQFGTALVAMLRERFRRVIEVRCGEKFEQTDDVFSIDFSTPSAYVQLLAVIATSCSTPERIVYAWSTQPLSDIAIDANLSSVLYLSLASAGRGWGKDVGLILLSVNAFDVWGTETVRPNSATLPAAAVALAKRDQGMTCGAIDVHLSDSDSREAVAAVARAAAAQAATDVVEPCVALRGPNRWRRTTAVYNPSHLADTGSLLREGGAYLIAGGTGGIGVVLAEYLIKTYSAKLLLVSRRSRPGAVQHLAAGDANIVMFSADVTDSSAMREAVGVALRRYGYLNGVIHAAGVAGIDMATLKTEQDLVSVLGPKIRGTEVLWDAVRGTGIDFFICCSSVAAINPPPGEFGYAAANAFQDAFAHMHDNPTGTRCISVNWDAWREVGMAARAAEDPANQIDPEYVAQWISPKTGQTIFDLILRNPLPQWIVTPTSSSTTSGEMRSALRAEVDSPAQIVSEQPILGSEPATPMVSELRSIWRELLAHDSFGMTDDFLAVGGDSLLLVELARRINAKFNRKITVRHLLAKSTLNALTDLLQSV
jgi:acyl transferase domain-containing protein/aryl carrier-like protein